MSLSVLSTLLAAALLTGCVAQPAVSTDAPVTTTAAVTTTTTATVTTTATETSTATTMTSAATAPATSTTTTKTTVATTSKTAKKTAMATTKTKPREYDIRFEEDASVGWERIPLGNLLIAGEKDYDDPDDLYVIDGHAEMYLNGKWVSLRRAIKNDPDVMKKIWNKARSDNAAKSTGNAYPKNFITMHQLRGYGVNYAKYSDYTLVYWTAHGEDPINYPCPVHEYPTIGDRKWIDLNEDEKQDYLKILREYEHSHNVRWYMIFPSDEPLPTWDDIYEKGICYMDL